MGWRQGGLPLLTAECKFCARVALELCDRVAEGLGNAPGFGRRQG